MKDTQRDRGIEVGMDMYKIEALGQAELQNGGEMEER